MRLFNIFLTLCLLGTAAQLNAQCDEDDNFWTESWRSCMRTTNPNPERGDTHWILYEFTEPIGIGATHIWNANRTNESDSGLHEVFVDISTDGTTWEQVGDGMFTWERAPETPDYEGFEGPTLSNYGYIEKVLITVVSTHGNVCASLAEIRFDVDKNACAGILDACGVCDGEGELTFYLDADGDGEGNQNIFVQACQPPENGYVTNNSDACDTGGWAQMSNIFDANSCTGCHNQGAEGGLDLTSYEGFLKGGDKCGPNIHTGNTLANIIQIEGYDGCGQPISGLSMNERTGNQLDDWEIAAIQAWIDAGAPRDTNCQEPIGEIEQSETLETTGLYPNPSTGIINIAKTPESSVSGVEVFDLGGRKIYEYYNDGEEISSVDLGSLNLFGMYLVRLVGSLEDGQSESFHKVFME